MKKIYLIVGAILWGGIVDAQTLSVEQYRQKVLEYNQDIQKSQQAVNGALYSLKGIKTGFFPKLDITGNYSYQLEKVEFLPGTDLKHDNYGVEAGLVQNVYSGSAVRKQYDVAKLQHAIAQLSVEHTVDNMIYAADVSYWSVAANRNLYELSEQFVQIVRELYEIVNKRFEEGAISKTDVLMVQNRLKEAELQLNTNSTNYKTALQSLNIMMGVEPDAAVVLTDSIQKVLWVPKQEGLNKALERRADYQSAIMGIEMAKLQTDMARSKYLPQLAVGIKEKYGTTLLNVDGPKNWKEASSRTR